jgi:hypothetical protein
LNAAMENMETMKDNAASATSSDKKDGKTPKNETKEQKAERSEQEKKAENEKRDKFLIAQSEYQANMQMFNMMANMTATSLKSLGEGLTSIARKQ